MIDLKNDQFELWYSQCNKTTGEWHVSVTRTVSAKSLAALVTEIADFGCPLGINSYSSKVDLWQWLRVWVAPKQPQDQGRWEMQYQHICTLLEYPMQKISVGKLKKLLAAVSAKI